MSLALITFAVKNGVIISTLTSVIASIGTTLNYVKPRSINYEFAKKIEELDLTYTLDMIGNLVKTISSINLSELATAHIKGILETLEKINNEMYQLRCMTNKYVIKPYIWFGLYDFNDKVEHLVILKGVLIRRYKLLLDTLSHVEPLIKNSTAISVIEQHQL